VTKVLYIEDNDDNVFMLKMRLELLGDFEVLTAEDGQKGCEMAATEQPDIILMDLEMPVVDGWEATRRLKGNPQTRDIPVIALSAHALGGEREKALAAGWQRVRQQADRIRSTGRDHAACSRAPQVRLPPLAELDRYQAISPRRGTLMRMCGLLLQPLGAGHAAAFS